MAPAMAAEAGETSGMAANPPTAAVEAEAGVAEAGTVASLLTEVEVVEAPAAAAAGLLIKVMRELVERAAKAEADTEVRAPVTEAEIAEADPRGPMVVAAAEIGDVRTA